MISGLSLLFLLTAALTLAGMLAAALLKNLVHCALSLSVTFAGLALLYLELGAQFVGFVQILVYIGAVAILVVFAILLTRGAGTPEYRSYSSHWFTGLGVACAVFALLVWAISRSLPASPATAAPVVSVQSIGVALMSAYALPLEIVAVLLTVALIGGVIVAMPETTSQDPYDAGSAAERNRPA